jgi:hypothetical protein
LELNTYNGIGTTYLGRCKFEQDDSFVTTKWFVVGFPLIPLGSVRVRNLGTEGIPFFKRTTHYEVVEEVPLDGLQVMRIYAYCLFILLWFIYWFEAKVPGLVRGAMWILGVLLPFGLRFVAKRMAGT